MTDSTIANLNDISSNGGVQNGDMFYVLRTGTPDADFRADADDVLAFVEDNATSFAAATHTHVLANISDAGSLAARNTIGTTQIDNDAVTYAKMQDVSATDKLLGRSTAGAGNIEEITCTAAARAFLDDVSASAMRTTLGLATVAETGSYADLSGTPGLGALASKSTVDLSTGDATGTLAASRFPALSGDVTTSAGSLSATIATNAVTNTKIAQMAAGTIKGNNSGSTANASDLSVTQTTAMLSTMVGDTGSGGTKGLVPAPSSGDAAAGKYLKADGTWTAPSGGSGDSLDTIFFGDGSDGNVTISSGTTTLIRDMYYNNLTISGAGQLQTNLFRVFVAGILDLSAAPANAIISVAPGAGGIGGAAGAAGSAGAATSATGKTLLAGQSGGAGSSGTTGNSVSPGPTAGSTSIGGIGGGGGNSEKGGNGSVGTGATLTAIATSVTGCDPRYPTTALFLGFPTTFTSSMGGTGGVGGGGDGTAAGGGGGGGAGANSIVIFANTINRSGSTTAGAIISTGANGGAGGTPASGSRGGGMGGCGGGGAYIALVYKTLSGTTATNMIQSKGGNGGNGGNGSGTGAGGYGGAGGKAGTIVLIKIGGTVSVSAGTRTISPSALAGVANSGTAGGSGTTGETLSASL